MAGSADQQVWYTGAEASRRLEVTQKVLLAFAVRNNIRRRIRADPPPLYHRDDVEAVAAQYRVEGEGVANGDGRPAENPRADEPEAVEA